MTYVLNDLYVSRPFATYFPCINSMNHQNNLILWRLLSLSLQMRNEVQRDEQPRGHQPARAGSCCRNPGSRPLEGATVQLPSLTLASQDPAETSQPVGGRRRPTDHLLAAAWASKCGQISDAPAAETPFSLPADSLSRSRLLLSGGGVAAGITGGSMGTLCWGLSLGTMCVWGGSHLQVPSLHRVLC